MSIEEPKQFFKLCPFCKTDTSLNKIDICDDCMMKMVEQQISLAKSGGGD